MLTRVAMPYRFHPHDSPAGRQLLEQAGEDGSRLPVVLFRTGQVLVDPSHAELSEFLGASTRPAPTTYDVAIVGAGPAGLAAAVSAASEGLATLVVEPEVFGGQGGTSSLIRNYPGFPHGISVRLRTEIIDGQGSGRLERLTLRDGRSQVTQTVAAAGLFVLIGAEPRTNWLCGTVACDERGYL